MLIGNWEIQARKSENVPLSQSVQMLWAGWCKWWSWLSCHKTSNGHCRNKCKGAGIDSKTFQAKSKMIFYLSFFSLLPSSQEAIFRVVAAILHLGNIDFAKGKEVDSSVPKDDKAKFHLDTTAELLMWAFLFSMKVDIYWQHLCSKLKIDFFFFFLKVWSGGIRRCAV